MPDVITLFHGYSVQLDESTMKANCTCTLIKGQKLIIVDTMTAWDKERLIEALAKENVKPSDIDCVVCTHSHADHIGNNNLFVNAEHIVGYCVHRGDTFIEKNLSTTEYDLCENVKIIATPGHTAEDVTVLVKTEDGGKCIAITGDLFERKEDIYDPSIWKQLGTKSLQKVQSVMRSNVINVADAIVPGHGPMFTVTNDMRERVKSQIIV